MVWIVAVQRERARHGRSAVGFVDIVGFVIRMRWNTRLDKINCQGGAGSGSHHQRKARRVQQFPPAADGIGIHHKRLVAGVVDLQNTSAVESVSERSILLLNRVEQHPVGAGQRVHILQANRRGRRGIGGGLHIVNHGDNVREIIPNRCVPLGAGHDICVGHHGFVRVFHREKHDVAVVGGVPGVQRILAVTDAALHLHVRHKIETKRIGARIETGAPYRLNRGCLVLRCRRVEQFIERVRVAWRIGSQHIGF